MNEAQRIKEAAQRLSEDDVLQKAFDGAVQEAYRRLATVKADDALAVVRIQAQIEAIAKIREALQHMIIQAQTERISGLAPTPRPQT